VVANFDVAVNFVRESKKLNGHMNPTLSSKFPVEAVVGLGSVGGNPQKLLIAVHRPVQHILLNKYFGDFPHGALRAGISLK
jgi:hypothetical protein